MADTTGTTQKKRAGRPSNFSPANARTENARHASIAYEKYVIPMGLSQAAVARRLGLKSGTYLGHLLSGEAEWSCKWMMKFALFIKVLPQEIWPNWEFSSITCGNIKGIEFRILLSIRSLTADRVESIDEFVAAQLREQAALAKPDLQAN